MPPVKKLPEPWNSFLSDVNGLLSEPVEVRCSGGFVLTMVYEISRSTGDIDYIDVIPNSASEQLEQIAGKKSALCKKHKLYLEFTGGITDLPDNYEERLQELSLGFDKLTVKALDPYDLALSKLGRSSPKDSEDVKALAKKLNLKYEILFKRFEEEMKPWVANAERMESIVAHVWRDYFLQ